MTAPFTLPIIDEHLQAELRHRYRETRDAEIRTRYQMLLLALDGQTSTHIARLVCRSQDTVVRALKRFVQGGLEAVPRRTAPGRQRTITLEWEAELLRVIELDPHEVDVESARWTTQLLADYLGRKRGSQSPRKRCASTCMLMAMSVSVPPGRSDAKPKNNPLTWETPAGRGSLGRYHSTRTSTRPRSC